jgi:hypothetical protein
LSSAGLCGTPGLFFKLAESLFLLYYFAIFNIKRGPIMGVLETILKAATDAAPHHPGFQTQPLYILLNLVSPLVVGILLAWVTKLIEKGLNHLLGDKR